MNIFTLLILVLGFAKSLEMVYWWQIKEYRFDRFRTYLGEQNVIKIIWGLQPRMAAKSVRNALIIVLNTLLFGVLSLVIVQIESSIVLTLILLVLAPLIGFLVTSVTVWATGLLATIKRERLIRKAVQLVDRSDTVFIGITGSYGKTTTKEHLYHIISRKFKVEKTDGTINTDIGIAQEIIDKLKPDTQYFITEIGAYRIGEIARIARILAPNYAILTALGNQHLDLFGSREKLMRAKKELLDALTATGVGYVNKDIKEYQRITKDIQATIVSFSTTQNADITATNIDIRPHKTRSRIIDRGRVLDIEYHLLGKHHLPDLLPAIALASDLGLSENEISERVRTLKPIPHKLSEHTGPNGCHVVSDSGNSSLHGFTSALEAIGSLKFDKKLVVSKGIIELGPERTSSYNAIAAMIKKIDATLYTTDALLAKLSEQNTELCRSEDEILNKIKKRLDKKSVLLIEGKFTKKFIDALIKV